ncbi:LysR family transcriptional regulator [Luteimonas kalidii]|uniref:LysR family transcriptional regulator n=1 Tax=Luteimonas kalidii TaxID=3042025 RepID=A0ABT6JVU6_9GAMM|nr:LysR family transcriptional regulator [Luteimonas kalidii]MDH5834066.1 LysR family transcriptional regulator [Luteimonas kalidii]
MVARALPPLNALRAFEAAARLGSMSRAAEELHVTHGAVSRQVRLLEDDLGAALFLREGRGLRLTTAGERLREATGTAFDQLQATVRTLRRGAGAGTRVIGCPGSLLARWIIPRLERLHADLPGLRLHLSAQDSDPDPALPGLDAVLLAGAPPWPAGWRVHALGPEQIGPVLSPRHPAFARLAGRPADALLDEAVLHTASRPQAWPQWARSQGLAPDRLRTGTGFEHLYYLLEAAVAGLGIAIAPAPLVAADLGADRLAAPWGFVETGAQWCLCTRTADDPQLDRLAAWLRTELAQGQPI